MDCMDILYELKDLLCEELMEINKKHDFKNMAELEVAYKAVDIIKDITTIEAMEESSFGGESYDDDMSYARNRDSMGRYSSRGRRNRRSYDNADRMMSMNRGYSGDDSKEEMMRKIDEMQRKLQQM